MKTRKPPLVFASTNPGKLREIRRMLSGVEIDVPVHGLDKETPVAPPRETGASFLQNACRKARYYARRLRAYAFAEDSGLCVVALGGRPGLRSARFLGAGASDSERCRAIIDSLDRQHARRHVSRAASFEAAGAVADPDGTILFTAETRCRGIITRELAGIRGFGYDPIFFYRPAAKTFAQMSVVEKNRVSHRGKLLGALRRYLVRSYPRPDSGKHRDRKHAPRSAGR